MDESFWFFFQKELLAFLPTQQLAGRQCGSGLGQLSIASNASVTETAGAHISLTQVIAAAPPAEAAYFASHRPDSVPGWSAPDHPAHVQQA